MAQQRYVGTRLPAMDTAKLTAEIAKAIRRGPLQWVLLGAALVGAVASTVAAVASVLVLLQ